MDRLRWYRGDVLLWLCLAAWVSVSAGVASGQDQPDGEPTIQNLQPGLAASLRNQSWAGLQVDLQNPGPAREVLLVAEHPGHASGQTLSFSHSVDLPTASLRRVELPVMADVPRVAKPQPVSGLTVRLTDGGLVTWARQDALGQVLPASRATLLVCDTRPSSLKFAEATRRGGSRAAISRLSIRPYEFPRRTLSLEGIDVVALGNLGGHVLDRGQQAALCRWIETGGLLLLYPGPDERALPLAGLADLAPARSAGSALVGRLACLDSFSAGFSAPSGIRRHRLVATGGRPLLGSDADPAAVARRFGNGLVIALAFDLGHPAFDEWEQSEALLRKTLPWPSPHVRYTAGRLQRADRIGEIMAGMTGIRVPSRQAVATYLGLVISLLAGTLWFSRRYRRGERGWAAAVGLALIMGCVAAQLAVKAKGVPQAVLNEIAVVRASGTNHFARIDAALGLFSPRDRDFRPGTVRDGDALYPERSRVRPPDVWPAQVDSLLEIEPLTVRANTLRTVFAHSSRDDVSCLPRVAFRFDDRGLVADVGADPGQTLEDAFIRYRRMVVPVGDIVASSGSVSVVVGREEAGSSPAYSARKVRAQIDHRRSLLLDELFPDRTLSATEGGLVHPLSDLPADAEWEVPALYYWSRTPWTRLAGLDDVARHSMGLCRVADLPALTPGRVLLPFGVGRREILHRSPGVSLLDGGGFGGRTEEAVLVAAFAPPGDVATFRPDSLRVACDVRGGVACELYVLPADVRQAEPSDLAAYAALGAGPEAAVPSPGTYYDDTQGRVVIAARVRRMRTGGSKGALADQPSPWRVTRLDLEMEGTVP